MPRVVMLLDMDCFYVQVEQRSMPETKGKPCIVVQYNDWKGGGIIASSYEARDAGITKGYRGDDAREKCPDVIIFRVPEKNGKADLTRYRQAGAEVIDILLEFTQKVERASIDEAYIDISDLVLADQTPVNLENSFYLGSEEEFKELFPTKDIVTPPACIPMADEGSNRFVTEKYSSEYVNTAILCHKIRLTIYERTGFRCSCGVGPNKTIAKLACTLNKPNRQTIVLPSGVPYLLQHTPIKKVRNFGGKTGAVIRENFKVEYMGDLLRFSMEDLMKEFDEKSAQWIYDICRGHEDEEVASRSLPKSIGCSKNFMGKSMITDTQQFLYWSSVMARELIQRTVLDFEDNKRIPTKTSLYIKIIQNLPKDSSKDTNRLLYPNGLFTSKNEVITSFLRSMPKVAPILKVSIPLISQIPKEDKDRLHNEEKSLSFKIADLMKESIHGDIKIDEKTLKLTPSVVGIGISASGLIITTNTKTQDIMTMFQNCPPKAPAPADTSLIILDNLPKGETNWDEEKANPPTLDIKSMILRQAERERSNPSKATADQPTLTTPSNDPATIGLPEAEEAEAKKKKKVEWIICEDCGKRVVVWEMEEHRDFHIAQKIQAEWAQEEGVTTHVPPKLIIPKSLEASSKPARRGGKTTSAVSTKNQKPSNQSSIKNFFSK